MPLARPLPAEACAALVGCVRLSGLSYPALLGARARFGDAAVLDELERRGAVPAPPTPRIGAARGLTVDVTVGADASFALGGLWWRLCTEVRGGAAPSLFLQLDRARCPFASVLAVGAAGVPPFRSAAVRSRGGGAVLLAAGPWLLESVQRLL